MPAEEYSIEYVEPKVLCVSTHGRFTEDRYNDNKYIQSHGFTNTVTLFITHQSKLQFRLNATRLDLCFVMLLCGMETHICFPGVIACIPAERQGHFPEAEHRVILSFTDSKFTLTQHLMSRLDVTLTRVYSCQCAVLHI